jgi:DNA polymerase-3 subunit delta'
LRAEGIDDAERWLALAGGAPLRAAAMGSADERAERSDRALLDALTAELGRGERFDAFAAAASLDRVVKAEKAPAALARLAGWVQHWLFDLTLAQAGLPVRYFVRERALLQSLAQATDLRRLLAFNAKALQYRTAAEQPLNSRLFLEDFCLGYAALFARS